MTTRKIIVCGPRPKTLVVGVDLAVELLVTGLGQVRASYVSIDTTFMNRKAKAGSFSCLRAIETMLVVFRVWLWMPFCKIYYSIMSTSPLGFIRDYLNVFFAKLLRRRTVLHLHGGGFEDFYISSKPWLQRLIRANLKRIDTIVVLGELLKDQFHCAGEFVKPKLLVIPNGLTHGVEEPVAAVKELPKNGRIQLLYLSSLMPSKGFFDVLQAMKLLEMEQPGLYHLNLCGSFTDAKTETAVEVRDDTTLHAYIQINDLSNCVTYHGQVLGEAKEKQFAQANIFLLPTSYPWEGQPLSIIEALAFSTPVISCYHKGIPELVEDRVNGFFVEPKSPKTIASTIIKMTTDAQSYSKMSVAARTHYEANFRREVHLERLISVIMDSTESEFPQETIGS